MSLFHQVAALAAMFAICFTATALAQPTAEEWHGWIDTQTASLFGEGVTWRRHFHIKFIFQPAWQAVRLFRSGFSAVDQR
ncbi:MAG: hypothetical protein RQ741_00380 [Wenzhouxiangellaceae bacterium]|nr:hypothetical protein [Wenzhouxiangellaceae bacterium]